MNRKETGVERYRRHADERTAVEDDGFINLEDDDAVEQLKERIARLISLQQRMKGANLAVRTPILNDSDKIDLVVHYGFRRLEAETMVLNKITFSQSVLFDNDAKIKAAKKQLFLAETFARIGNREYAIDGIVIEERYSEDRIYISFPGEPNACMKTMLKKYGFSWAPSMGCWQACISNWTLSFIEEISSQANKTE